MLHNKEWLHKTSAVGILRPVSSRALSRVITWDGPFLFELEVWLALKKLRAEATFIVLD